MVNAHQPELSWWAVLIKALHSAFLNAQKHCPPYTKTLSTRVEYGFERDRIPNPKMDGIYSSSHIA